MGGAGHPPHGAGVVDGVVDGGFDSGAKPVSLGDRQGWVDVAVHVEDQGPAGPPALHGDGLHAGDTFGGPCRGG